MISEDYKRKAGLTPEQIADTIAQFYQKVDEAAQNTLKALARDQHVLKCQKGCCACCLDDLTVTPAEVSLIRRDYPDVLNQTPHAAGQCAFLNEAGECRIYPARPYICRTHGLPLRWIDEDEEGPFEERDTCELNQHLELSQLEQDQCFTLGVPELQLQKMNEITFPQTDRIPLRSLFSKH